MNISMHFTSNPSDQSCAALDQWNEYMTHDLNALPYHCTDLWSLVTPSLSLQ